MKRWTTAIIQTTIILCSIFMADLPALAQHGTLGVSLGETSDRFGALQRYTGFEGILDGQAIVYKSPDKVTGADVVVGGEVRIPQDTQNHAREFAVFGGPEFRFGQHWSAGFHVQMHWFYLPPSMNIPPGIVVGTVFYRPRIWILEPPGFVQYKFGADNRFFVRAEGGPELGPHFHYTVPTDLPNPDLDHGYTVRGTLGYNFGKWYVKGSYETRYLKFREYPGGPSNNLSNPGNFYSWRSDRAMGGVGINF